MEVQGVVGVPEGFGKGEGGLIGLRGVLRDCEVFQEVSEWPTKGREQTIFF